MRAGYLWCRTSRVREFLDLVRALECCPGVEISADHQGLSVADRGHALFRVDWKGRLDMFPRREIRERVMSDEMSSEGESMWG
jgi:hypothetical protein